MKVGSYQASDDYFWMALTGCVGVLCFPVLFFAIVIYATLRRPSVLAGESSEMIQRYRFLFTRFKVQSYYFAPVYVGRSFLLAFVPVFFWGNNPYREILALSAVFIVTGFLISRVSQIPSFPQPPACGCSAACRLLPVGVWC